MTLPQEIVHDLLGPLARQKAAGCFRKNFETLSAFRSRTRSLCAGVMSCDMPTRRMSHHRGSTQDTPFRRRPLGRPSTTIRWLEVVGLTTEPCLPLGIDILAIIGCRVERNVS